MKVDGSSMGIDCYVKHANLIKFWIRKRNIDRGGVDRTTMHRRWDCQIVDEIGKWKQGNTK